MNFSLTIVFILIVYTVLYTVSIWYSSKQSYETTTRSILILLAAGTGLFYIIFSFMSNNENDKYDDLYTEYQKNEARIRTIESLYDDKLEDIKKWKAMMDMMRFSNNRGAGNVHPVIDLWKFLGVPRDPKKGFTEGEIDNLKNKLKEYIENFSYIKKDDYMYSTYEDKLNRRGINAKTKSLKTPEDITVSAGDHQVYNKETLEELFQLIQKENDMMEKQRLKIIYNSLVDCIRDTFNDAISKIIKDTQDGKFEDLYFKFNTGKKFLVKCKQEIREIKKRQKEILQGYYSKTVDRETPFSITTATPTP